MTDYILDAETYLPKFMKDSDLLLSIMDCLNVLISNKQPYFEEIEAAYYDMIYRVRDYSKLTYTAKLNIIKELGFDYIIDIISITSDQLTKLLTFFNLIYCLKGKREGLDLVFQTLGLTYEYVTWDETSPRGRKFTATLSIVGNEYSETKVFEKLKTFVRSYMLPWVDITVELTIDAPNMYIFPCAFINMGEVDENATFTTTRDTANIALYDVGSYDIDSYGAEINTGPNQYTTFEFDYVTLTIKSNKSSATILINGEEISEKSVERGAPISYSVTYEDTTKEGYIVCNQNKTLTINF